MRLDQLPTGARVGPASADPGALLAVDTARRYAELARAPFRTVGVPPGWEHLNVHPSSDPGPADVELTAPPLGGVPPYRLAHRLAWLAGTTVEAAEEELGAWRRLVAGWAEEPSRPMCAQVQQDLLAAAATLETGTAVAVLRGSLDLGLPPGCLFETWAWADRLLGLDLAADVGR